ncbi:hypothetical protein WME90_17835 [Sorangium sp. So ce375]|uniref:hypothetical protein n=1 Tax=Sorangium sp. So ce375 TaxID=3133306 RepID=UPI003F5B8E74
MDPAVDAASAQIVVANPEHRIMVGASAGSPLGPERAALGGDIERAAAPRAPLFSAGTVP